MTPKEKPYSSRAKPVLQRAVIGDCEFGDIVEFIGTPIVFIGAEPVTAPSRTAVVTMRITGAVYVRFIDEDGVNGEPVRIAEGSRIKRIDGYR